MDLKLLKMLCKDSKQHHVIFHEFYSVSSLLCIAQNVRFEIPYNVLYFETPFLMIFKYYAWASYGKTTFKSQSRLRAASRGGGGTPYNGLYGEAPPERSTFFRLQVYERVGVSRAEVYEREGNLSFRYLKGPLIKIFRVNAPYDCIT